MIDEATKGKHCNASCCDYYCPQNVSGRCQAPNKCLGVEEAAELMDELEAAKREIAALRKREFSDVAKLREALVKARRFIDSSPLMYIEDNTVTIARGELCAEIDAALAAPATAEKSSAVGDVAKLREALAYLFTLIDMRKLVLDCDETEEIYAVQVMLDECRAALAAPPRNCDVGTADEQFERFGQFCNRYDDDCTGCPCDTADSSWNFTNCFARWAQMPYEEGGAK